MALLLDLDNTLFDSSSIYDSTIKRLESEAKELGFASGAEFRKVYESARKETKLEFPKHPINRLRILYFKKVSEKAFGRTIPSLVLKLDALYFRFFLAGIRDYKKKNAKEYSKILTVLRELQKDMDLVFVTNESLRTQILKLSVLIPKDIRYRLVTSEEAGEEKPSPLLFQKALEGTRNEKSYLLGDSLRDDIIGAIGIGAEPFHILKPIESGVKKKSTIQRKSLPGKGEYWESPDLISALNYVLSLEKGILVT